VTCYTGNDEALRFASYPDVPKGKISIRHLCRTVPCTHHVKQYFSDIIAKYVINFFSSFAKILRNHYQDFSENVYRLTDDELTEINGRA
jgi:hypothetical protein